MERTPHDPQTIGIFTGGGTAPGLNRVIFGATAVLQKEGHRVLGLPDGWAGVLEVPKDILELSALNRWELSSLLRGGGSALGSSRTKITPDKYPRVGATVDALGLDGLIAIGGDDTLGQAAELQRAGVIRAIGVPKTIDNDVHGTDKTFGFDTACQEAARFIDRMGVDAQTMRRAAVVEIMGRNAGHITLEAAVAGGAHITLIPEFPIQRERLLERVREVFAARRHVVIAIAEGYGHFQTEEEKQRRDTDPFGHKKQEGAAKSLARIIKKELGIDTQEQVAGYHVRSGAPLASDGNFAHQMGGMAGWLAHVRDYGKMVSLQKGEIVAAPLENVKGGRNVTELEYDPEEMMRRDVPPAIAARILEERRRVVEATALESAYLSQ